MQIDAKKQLCRIAQRYANSDHVYFLGRGLDYAVALEAALKLKEISYIHAEAYPFGELKHGSLALIENGVSVVACMCDERTIEKSISNLNEILARGADVLIVTTEKYADVLYKEDCLLLVIPETHPLMLPSTEIIPLQLLSYHIAKLRGCDIDKPRNLAKSVTVE